MQRKNLNLTQSQTSFIPTQNVIPTTLTTLIVDRETVA